MAAKRRDHKGHKYGHLTLLYPVRSGGSGKGVYWMARCDCGNIKEVRGSEAAAGKVKTCGSCKYHTELLEEAAEKGVKLRGWTKAIRVQHLRYIRSAVKRGIEWRLSPEEFLSLVKSYCHYCWEEPRTYTGKFSRKGKNHTAIINGIDRVDSTLGYVSGNVVSACSECNQSKMARSADRFVHHCTKVTRVQVLKNKGVTKETQHLYIEEE